MNKPFRKYSILIFFAAALLGVPGETGATNFREANAKSHELFQAKKWKETVEYVNEVLDGGLEFMFAYYRRGIANYNMGKYRLAVPDFEKVIEYNSQDYVAHEYLYYSRLFGWTIQSG